MVWLGKLLYGHGNGRKRYVGNEITMSYDLNFVQIFF